MQSTSARVELESWRWLAMMLSTPELKLEAERHVARLTRIVVAQLIRGDA